MLAGGQLRLGQIAGFGPRVAYRRPGGPVVELSPGMLAAEGATRWIAADAAVALAVSAEAAPHGGSVLTATVTNRSSSPIELIELAPLHLLTSGTVVLGRGPAAWSVYRNGWSSWSLVRRFTTAETDKDPWFFVVREEACDPETPRRGEPGVLRSELVTAIADSTADEALVIGFVGSTRAFGVIDIRTDDAHVTGLDATCRFDGISLAPGEEVRSEPLLVNTGPDGVALLEGWADELGRRQHARIPERPPGGWCSWYYYFTSITEQALRDNLAEMDRLAAHMPVDYVMVDDGHQQAIGDWLRTNEKFPSGMAAVADAIKATGRDAGIWIAPFIVDPRSTVARAHPDWLLRDDDEKPVRALWNPLWTRTRPMRALDCTRKDVQAWLAETARVIRHDWGFKVIKIDFTYAAALPGRRHDPTATRAMALRAGLQAIRDGAGEDAFILGCGMPLGPAVGMVDGMRIGPDVAPYWNLAITKWATRDTAGATTEGAIRSALTRAFMHGRLWANDPDCLMVRDERTRLTSDEIHTLVAVAGLTDGMLVASDRTPKVPEERMAMLDLAGTLAGGRCRVVDLLGSACPELLVSEHDDVTYIGVLNMSHGAVHKRVDLTALGLPVNAATDLATGRVIDPTGSVLDLGEVPKHASVVLRVSRRN